eukprot:4405459-Prymnesium_polylepis.1
MRRRWRTGLGTYVHRGALAARRRAGRPRQRSASLRLLLCANSCRDSTTGEEANAFGYPAVFCRDDAPARQDSGSSKWNGPDLFMFSCRRVVVFTQGTHSNQRHGTGADGPAR